MSDAEIFIARQQAAGRQARPDEIRLDAGKSHIGDPPMAQTRKIIHRQFRLSREIGHHGIEPFVRGSEQHGRDLLPFQAVVVIPRNEPRRLIGKHRIIRVFQFLTEDLRADLRHLPEGEQGKVSVLRQQFLLRQHQTGIGGLARSRHADPDQIRAAPLQGARLRMRMAVQFRRLVQNFPAAFFRHPAIRLVVQDRGDHRM